MQTPNGAIFCSASNIRRGATARKPGWAPWGSTGRGSLIDLSSSPTAPPGSTTTNCVPPLPASAAGCGFVYQNWLGGDSERIFGANFWYDGTHTSGLTPTDNYYYFQQFGVGLESLGDRWDFRVNANFPVGNTAFAGPTTTSVVGFDEHFLDAQVSQYTRYAVTTVEGEVARRIGDRNLWAFASCYGLDGGGEQAVGGKAGLRGYLRRDVLASLSVANDGMFDTTVMFNITWFIDWGAHGRADMAPACLTDRLREPVQRNDYVAVVTKQQVSDRSRYRRLRNALVLRSRRQQRGRGRRRHLPASLQHPAAGPNQLLGGRLPLFAWKQRVHRPVDQPQGFAKFVWRGRARRPYNQCLRERPAHRLALPETGGAIPEIFNAPGASAVQLANNNNIWGLVIDTAVNGITAPSGTTNATINHVTVQNAAGAGLNFQATSGSVTVGQYTYAGGSGSGINVQNSTANFAFTDVNVATSGAADAVSLTGNTGATIAFNGLNIAATGSGRGFAASGGGTLAVTGSSNTISSATGTALDLNGVAVSGSGMTFQSATANGAPHGVSLVNVNGGPITVAGGTISNSTAEAVYIDGGTPVATIDATLLNNANRSVDVESLTGGSVTIGGSITDNGDGRSGENNTGGSVTFTGTMNLTTRRQQRRHLDGQHGHRRSPSTAQA